MGGLRKVAAGAGWCVAMAAVAGCGGHRSMAATAAAPTPAAVEAANDVMAASATLMDAKGASVGSADLTSDDNGGVHLVLRVTGLPPGQHGVHFHSVASCVGTGATPFASAGGHHNPLNRQHGLENAEGPHAGDLPNLTVGADGTGTLDAVTPRATLRSGPATLFDPDGSAIVVHAAADDQKTDPSGNSGARIACGVVEGK